ncbi:MAG: alcohol dehydrogenase catalytic domain-containing protein [Chloroflexi bacterium]|nr:alcohol dehydrogenase catalytic domain-containing protein [Chloroflexota bacterium]
MKAIVLYGNKDLRLVDDWPEPVPVPGEVKLKVTYTSICATDIEEWQFGPRFAAATPNPITGKKLPLALGHEVAGRVVQVGQGVTGLKPGDRVAVEDVITCGTCYWCRKGEFSSCPSMAVTGFSADGGLAEFVVWRADHCIKLPASVSDEEAPLVEPATVAVHAARRSRAGLGDRVAVIGCGTVGLLTLQAVRAAGATAFAVDVRQQSLDLAKSFGADAVIDAGKADAGQALRKLTDDIGPDVVIETAGAARTPIDAIQWVRRRGTVVLVGIYAAKPEFNFLDIVDGEKRVIGSVAADPQDFRTAVALIAEGRIRVKPLITVKVPLERGIEDGFKRMLKPQKDVYRILVGAGA